MYFSLLQCVVVDEAQVLEGALRFRVFLMTFLFLQPKDEGTPYRTRGFVKNERHLFVSAM